MFARIFIASAVLWIASAAWADSLPSNVRSAVREYAKTKANDDLNNLTGTDLVSFYIHDRIVEEQGSPESFSINAFRRDLQLGSFAPTGGSTSIVARPGISDLLSAAVESGAVGRKSDDKSMTVSFSALPIYQLMSGRIPRGCGTLDADCEAGPGRWLRGLSGSITGNMSNPTVAVPAATALPGGLPTSLEGFLLGGRQLTALAVRYDLFVRERDKKLSEGLTKAAMELSASAAIFLASQAPFETELRRVLTSSGWVADTRKALADAAALPNASAETLEGVLLYRYRLAWDLAMAAPAISSNVAGVFLAKTNYIRQQNKLLAERLYRKALTVDYLHQRPTDQARLHQLRLVLSTPLGRKPSDPVTRSSAIPSASVTLNGGVTFYDNTGETVTKGRVRDAQASIAFDWSPAAWGAVRPTYTAAYYFQYMIQNGVIDFNRESVTPGGAGISLPRAAIEVLNTRGPVHIAQVRVNIPIGTSGVAFPAAVSYSNRTELITGRPFWQGHIGVSYDLSSLKKLLPKAAAGGG